MDLSTLYEKTTEDLIDKKDAGSLEIIYDYLESHGYAVSFRYSRCPITSEVERRFYLFNYHCGENASLGFLSDATEVKLKDDVIASLKAEYCNMSRQYFEVVDELDTMYELSSNLPLVMSYCMLAEDESFMEFYERAILPSIKFLERELKKTKSGKKECYKYEKLVGIFLNIYFLAAGFKVSYQQANASNQHRRDFFVRAKISDDQNFNSLLNETKSKSIVVECKNSSVRKQFIDAVNQVERYSRASSFGKLSIVLMRKKCEIFKITDYLSSTCIIVVMDDSDISKSLINMELSFNFYKSHKNRVRLLQDINGCGDFYERYQEICER